MLPLLYSPTVGSVLPWTRTQVWGLLVLERPHVTSSRRLSLVWPRVMFRMRQDRSSSVPARLQGLNQQFMLYEIFSNRMGLKQFFWSTPVMHSTRSTITQPFITSNSNALTSPFSWLIHTGLLLRRQSNLVLGGNHTRWSHGDATATLPLIKQLSDSVIQVWYADDASAVGSITNLREWWDNLTRLGPGYDYFPNPSSRMLPMLPLPMGFWVSAAIYFVQYQMWVIIFFVGKHHTNGQLWLETHHLITLIVTYLAYQLD